MKNLSKKEEQMVIAAQKHVAYVILVPKKTGRFDDFFEELAPLIRYFFCASSVPAVSNFETAFYKNIMHNF